MVDVAFTWEVDSYHVNCGIGDCSIHILVKVSADGSSELKRVLLLDGGTGRGTETAVPLNRTIELIEGNPRYWNGGTGYLQFHAVVISHWDEDHWGGIARMLRDAYDENNSGLRFRGRYKRFIYTDSGPETMVYAQDINTKNKGGLIFEEDDNGKRTMGYARSDLHDTLSNVANAQWGEDLIGTEFFSSKPLAGTKHDKIRNLSDLVSHHGHPPVGLYCVAAEELVIGLKKKTSAGWPWSIKQVPEQTMQIERTTDTNRGSLCHILVWWSATQAPRVSHYLGADLNARTESYITHWLEGSGVNRITCMKASHHGAKSSNPPRFLQKFRPKRIIVSARDKHGHPCK
jgi:hypothetical protein